LPSMCGLGLSMIIWSVLTCAAYLWHSPNISPRHLIRAAASGASGSPSRNVHELCALFFYSFQSLLKFCHDQIVVSITICCPERSEIKYTWIPSRIYQNMVNLVSSLCIGRCQVNLWMLRRGIKHLI
jgi:hypothetical protein